MVSLRFKAMDIELIETKTKSKKTPTPLPKMDGQLLALIPTKEEHEEFLQLPSKKKAQKFINERGFYRALRRDMIYNLEALLDFNSETIKASNKELRNVGVKNKWDQRYHNYVGITHFTGIPNELLKRFLSIKKAGPWREKFLANQILEANKIFQFNKQVPHVAKEKLLRDYGEALRTGPFKTILTKYLMTLNESSSGVRTYELRKDWGFEVA